METIPLSTEQLTSLISGKSAMIKPVVIKEFLLNKGDSLTVQNSSYSCTAEIIDIDIDGWGIIHKSGLSVKLQQKKVA